jgi:hypothetical protein
VIELDHRVLIDQPQLAQLQRLDQHRLERLDLPGLRDVWRDRDEDGLRRARFGLVVTKYEPGGLGRRRNDLRPLVEQQAGDPGVWRGRDLAQGDDRQPAPFELLTRDERQGDPSIGIAMRQLADGQRRVTPLEGAAVTEQI